MNDQNQVVGAVEIDNLYFPAISDNGVLRQLPVIRPESSGWAQSINNRGVIVGGLGIPVRWIDGELEVLDSNGHYGSAYDISENGMIVGMDSDERFREMATIWDPLARVLGLPRTWAYRVNESGSVAGWRHVDGDYEGVIWSPDGEPTYTGITHPYNWPITGFNDRGDYSGVMRDPFQKNYVAFIVRDGEFSALESCAFDWPAVWGMDSTGRRVIGSCATRGVMWEDGRLVLLDDFVDDDNWGIMRATAMNSRGEIAAEARYRGVEGYGVVLRPIFSLFLTRQFVSGQAGAVTIRNASAGEEVHLYHSVTGPGSTTVPELGVTLDLDDAQLLWSGPADDIGLAPHEQELSRYQSGRTIWLQAARVGDTTNPLEVTIEPSPFVLKVSPLVAGENATLTITAAAPHEGVYIFLSRRGEGSTRVRPLHVDLNLDLPLLYGSAVTDENGEASFSRTIGFANRHRVIWVQAAQLGGLSNLVITQVN